MRRTRLVATLAALIAVARAAAADAATWTQHLDSPRADERAAAVALVASGHDPAGARAVLALCAKREWASQVDRDLLRQAIAGLPIAELTTAITAADDAGVDLLADAGGTHPVDEVVAASERLAATAPTRASALLMAGLRHLAPGDDAGRQRLVAPMLKGDAPSRAAAVASFPWSDFTPAVQDAFAADPSPLVRVALGRRCEDLTRGGSDTGHTRRLLVRLAGDADAGVRAVAVGALGGAHAKDLGDAEQQRLEHATLMARLDDEAPATRAAACSWAASDPDPAVTDKLVALAAQKPTELAAMNALDARDYAGIGDIAAHAVKSSEQWHRRVAIGILAKRRDPRTAELANRLLDDPDSSVRDDAAKALEEVTGVDQHVAKAAGRIGDAKHRGQALQALLSLDDAQRLRELERLYAAEPPERRAAFVVEAGRICLPFLVARVADPLPAVACAAIRSLPPRSPYHHALQPGLVEALARLDDKDRAVAEAAHWYARQSDLAAVQATLCLRDLQRGRDIEWNLGNSGELRLAPAALLPALTGDDAAARATALRSLPVDAWDDEKLVAAIVAAAPSPEYLPQGAPIGDAAKPLIELARRGDAPAREKALAVLGRCDAPGVDAALREAASAPERAVRWAARDALLRRGDDSPATIDYALARLLTADQNYWLSMPWPVPTPAVTARLDTFAQLAPPAALAALRAELDRRARDLAADKTAAKATAVAEPVDDGGFVPVKAGQLDGLEGVTWQATTMSHWNPCVVSRRSLDGATVLHVASPGGAHENFGVDCALSGIGAPTSFAFDIARTGAALKVSVALYTGEQSEFFESTQRDVPGDGKPHHVSFDLRAGDFKCEQTQWQYATTVANLQDIRQVIVLVYAGRAACEVDVGRIGFAKGK